MSDSPHDFQADLNAIDDIAAVPSILEVISETTGMGFVAVARVTEGRWVACKVLDGIDFGLKEGGELVVETTICHEIRASHEAVAIDDVANSPYRGHHTPLQYGFRSYISVPIIQKDGALFGTLCAIDPKPAQVNNRKTLTMFRLFAEMIANHLAARRQLIETEENLRRELEVAKIREQFIAVLGHDLRNPLASMTAGTRILAKAQLDNKSRSVVALMLKSVGRMSNLVDNVMDFARGRLGGGISLRRTDDPLEPTLQQVVDEMRSVWTDREIETDFDLSHPTRMDHPRLAQLFSNLLGNALTHGASDAPVRVRAVTSADAFELWLENAGDPIPEEALDRLFQPFTRPMDHAAKEGLGLGLYIASQIAAAHGGILSVTSSPDETRFTLRVPSEE
ncbi:GAF domain-containing sensor histidine kinase [Agrobacterium vitis]|uniref:GAF domain-containing sensor histidine kinase n=1 Tax=Agrobacterium vitis TaxID=373 RepID=UPI002036304B|nr:GAF domain-containing sensor histidine kinase [Agrobacterium vitis]MCM2450105.1 GAF domain-containing sensor histidine kinase [Agrobacterium vitis]